MAEWLTKAFSFGRSRREDVATFAAREMPEAPNDAPPEAPKPAKYDVVVESRLFDADWYARTYPDVAAAGIDPIEHYLLYGAEEGRDPNPFFSTRHYLERNPEVSKKRVNPLVDFIEGGALERRNPSEYFDCEWYLNMYRDVPAAGLNPLQHFMEHGETEGRWPNPSFSPRFYRSRHLAGEEATISPLLHYIEVGRRRGLETREDPAERYQNMTRVQERRLSAEQSEHEQHIGCMIALPHFFIYVEGGAATAVGKMDPQLYPHWTVCGAKDELVRLVEQRGDAPWFMIWASSDDAFHRTALYRFACEYEANPSVDVVYGDDDCLNEQGRRIDPFYKPACSPDYLESCNYIGSAACVRGALAREVLFDAASQYDFLLRATERALEIVHVDRILAHRGRPMTGMRSASEQESDRLAISEALKRAGRQGVVTAVRPGVPCYSIAPARASGPLPVSIVVPTAGQNAILKGKSVDLIMALVSGIRNTPSYEDVEIIAVVNEDMTDEKRSALHELRVRTVVYRHEEVNIAKKINLGASVAEREYLLLLNDDIEPLSADWIGSMLAQFDKPHVGAVGAKLLYGDMKIQHVGVVHNSGNPDHPRSRYPHDDDGYFFSSIATRNFLAVTGAVMMTRRSLFEAVGGFEQELAISYNDVDYCLKLRELGKFSVYCPAATLIHYESLSRTRILKMSELHYFHKRWGYISTDPYYNEEFLTMAPPTFEACNNGKLIG